ncbi:hypothetical protein FSP39_015093 [Pinctada imbricata]|uniref:Phosphatidylinositol-4,5-bisphosphate 4-phosphatase n=1 Tax=Pinctada imbricata TaxID=66713 RepID=A0AA88XJ68_PINIB|nr:hypothetical protein FSP39_015093 [Pinctada imbricata]
MADREEERAPLLGNQGTIQGIPSGPPPQYTSQVDPQSVPSYVQDELPPPYTPSAHRATVNCKVCQALINIEGKQNQHVVKCDVCKEATAIKAPPPGKRYVRCPCNCLLICRSESTKIACPRPNCKRIINLGSTVTQVILPSPGSERFICAFCNNTFVFNSLGAVQLARCPHCRRVSSISASYVRNRCLVYIIVGILFLSSGVGVTVGTYELAESSGGIYTVWIGAFVLGILFLIRGFYFSCIRVSERENRNV